MKQRKLTASSRRARTAALAALMAVLAGALCFTGGDARVGAESVSADSILATARALSGETGIGPPSRFGPLPSTALYAAYLRGRLDAALEPLGGYAVLDTFYPGFDYDGPHPIRHAYTNVRGLLPGAHSGPDQGYFILGAHFDGTSMREALTDTTWDPFTAPAPGADDNGSGVAVILEALRLAAVRGLRPQADVVVTFFDGEEQQLVEKDRFLLGSTFMADSVITSGGFAPRPLFGVVNVDMVAYNPRRDSLVVVTNLPSRWLADEVVRAHGTLDDPEGLELTRLVQGLNYSDHASFWAQGHDAILVIEAASIEAHAPHYHKKLDTVDFAYSRQGSQAARASELVLGMLENWSDPGPRCLELTGEDLLFQRDLPTTRVVDASVVSPGDAVELVVGVTNRGGTGTGAWALEVDLETLDGQFIRTLGSRAGADPALAGARQTFSFPWVPEAAEIGMVRARARVVAEDHCGAPEATRSVAVQGPQSEIVRAYVYPNPTRDPGSATLHYELAEEGAVRVTVLDLTGRELATRDFPYDRALPDPEVDVGGADVALDEVLEGISPAPGLYLVRVELFDRDGGGSADVGVAKMVVLR